MCDIQVDRPRAVLTAHSATMREARARAAVTGSAPTRMLIRRLLVWTHARIVDTLDRAHRSVAPAAA